MNPNKKICKLIEVTTGRKIKTPKDFNWLAERIYDRLHQQISSTTLKRLWGYQQDEGPSRITTMNILAQFCGYKDWESFSNNSSKEESQSAMILNNCLQTMDLDEGDKVKLVWAPNRVCIVEYKGLQTFEILDVQNSKLQVGNTFECSVFVEQEPLLIHNLIQNGQPGVCYSAGRIDGIRFELIKKRTKENND